MEARSWVHRYNAILCPVRNTIIPYVNTLHPHYIPNLANQEPSIMFTQWQKRSSADCFESRTAYQAAAAIAASSAIQNTTRSVVRREWLSGRFECHAGTHLVLGVLRSGFVPRTMQKIRAHYADAFPSLHNLGLIRGLSTTMKAGLGRGESHGGLSTGRFYALGIAHTHKKRLTEAVNHGGGCYKMFEPGWLDRMDHLKLFFE